MDAGFDYNLYIHIVMGWGERGVLFNGLQVYTHRPGMGVREGYCSMTYKVILIVLGRGSKKEYY